MIFVVRRQNICETRFKNNCLVVRQTSYQVYEEFHCRLNLVSHFRTKTFGDHNFKLVDLIHEHSDSTILLGTVYVSSRSIHLLSLWKTAVLGSFFLFLKSLRLKSNRFSIFIGLFRRNTQHFSPLSSVRRLIDSLCCFSIYLPQLWAVCVICRRSVPQNSPLITVSGRILLDTRMLIIVANRDCSQVS